MQKRLAISVPRSKIKAYHSHVIEQLENLLDDEILVDFHFIMKSRVEADYLLSMSIGSKNFKECLECSDRIITGIEGGSKLKSDASEDLDYYKETRKKP
nr:hypothetical protein [Candidatus Sigynarchaeota archaeon]